jgi:ApbE superfamily uncharacterized protein (UPF0280 family)
MRSAISRDYQGIEPWEMKGVCREGADMGESFSVGKERE